MPEAKFKEYKVITIMEGGCGSVFFGASGIPVKKMENELNKHLADGYEVVFQVIEKKRFLLLWRREALIITLGKK